MRILGIDPGLCKTGWSILDSSHVVLGSGQIVTYTKDCIGSRLFYIFESIKSVIEKYSPEQAAIENTYVNSNAATSLQLAHARASAIISAHSMGLQIFYYQAKTVKKNVAGYGNASKDSIKKMLSMRIKGIESITSHDTLDSVALALCHLLSSTQN